MFLLRASIAEYAHNRGESAATLNSVYDALSSLNVELKTHEDVVMPSILLEPHSFSNELCCALTGDAARQYFLSMGMAEAQATTEECAIVGRIAVHQVRLRTLRTPMRVDFVVCGCPIIPLGAVEIDPMSFILLGQQSQADLEDHFGPQRIGRRRAKRIKEMASRLVDDILDT